MKSNVTLVQYLSKVRYMFYGVTHEDSVEKLENLPDYIQEATAFFFFFVIIETIYLACTKRGDKFRINAAIVSATSGLLMKMFMIIFTNLDFRAYYWINSNYRLIDVPWNSAWAWWLCFIGVDLGYYWFHRFAHEVNIMWAAHQVHHSSEDYNLATALRQSAFQHCTSWLFYLPLAPIIPTQMFVAHLQFNTLYQFWIHAAVVGKLGPLEWVLNTPSHHRVHHGRNRYCIDKNYAGTLIIWDRLFGTFEAENDEVVYGLVHNLDSFDPIYVQFCHLLYMWDLIKNSTGLKHTLSILFKGPGWAPNKPRLGLIEDIPDVKAPAVKYSPKISNWLGCYMFLHFILTTLCFQELNIKINHFSSYSVALFVIYILLSLTAIGATLDNRSQSPYLHLFTNILFLLGQKYLGSVTFLPFPYSLWLTKIMHSYAALSTIYWGAACVIKQFSKSKLA